MPGALHQGREGDAFGPVARVVVAREILARDAIGDAAFGEFGEGARPIWRVVVEIALLREVLGTRHRHRVEMLVGNEHGQPVVSASCVHVGEERGRERGERRC